MGVPHILSFVAVVWERMGAAQLLGSAGLCQAVWAKLPASAGAEDTSVSAHSVDVQISVGWESSEDCSELRPWKERSQK